MPALNPFSHAFGIDLGDQTFRLIQAVKKPRTSGYRIIAWSEVNVPEDVIVHGEIKDAAKAAETVVKLVKTARGHLKGRSVVASLPEAHTFIKIIDLPKRFEPENLQNVLLGEIAQNIPLPPDDIYFDTQEVERKKDDASVHAHEEGMTEEEPVRSMVLGAAPKHLVDAYASILEAAGLAPLALEMEAMAVARAAIPDAEPQTEPVGILDIGATRSSLVIFDGGIIQMSIGIPLSGIEITKAVADTLHVDFAEAEKLKRNCGLDSQKCNSRLWNALSPLIDDISVKIRNATRFYKIGFPHGRNIETILLTGGGAQLLEVDHVLSRRLTLRVRKAEPLANIQPPTPSSFPADHALSFTTAIGVAISAADRHEEFRKFTV